MNLNDLMAASALVFDALEKLAGETSPAAISATGRLHAAARILRRADAEAAREMQQQMALCDSYRTFDDDEDLPFKSDAYFPGLIVGPGFPLSFTGVKTMTTNSNTSLQAHIVYTQYALCHYVADLTSALRSLRAMRRSSELASLDPAITRLQHLRAEVREEINGIDDLLGKPS